MTAERESLINSIFKAGIARLPLARSPLARWPLAALVIFYIVMWIGGVGSHLLFGEAPQNAKWAAPTFLLLAGLIVLLTARGAEILALLVASALGFAAEAIGVRFGLPFGDYHYTEALGPRLLSVPLVMTSAWMTLAAYARGMLPERLPAWARIFFAALWMTAIDLVIDPLAAGSLGYWRWAEPGAYYGIPARNFAGWFATSLLIFGVMELLFRRGRAGSPLACHIGLSIIIFFTFIALAHGLVLAAIIGVSLCLIHINCRR